MQGIIVSDTSCLILLNKIGCLSILESLFGSVTITSKIKEEFNSELPSYIKVKDPEEKNYQKLIERTLDAGEASAIALALELKKCLLIIDEAKGRKEARALNIPYTGTLGLLVLAKDKGIIKSLSEIVSKIKDTNFRISENLLNEALRRCNEL